MLPAASRMYISGKLTSNVGQGPELNRFDVGISSHDLTIVAKYPSHCLQFSVSIFYLFIGQNIKIKSCIYGT